MRATLDQPRCVLTAGIAKVSVIATPDAPAAMDENFSLSPSLADCLSKSRNLDLAFLDLIVLVHIDP